MPTPTDPTVNNSLMPEYDPLFLLLDRDLARLERVRSYRRRPSSRTSSWRQCRRTGGRA